MPVGYRLDPGEARTDLYGIGKGEAQVIDLTPLRENAANEQKYNFAKSSAKQKRSEAREDDIYADIGNLDKVAIYAGHQPEFAQKQKKLQEYTKKNIQGLRSGDSDAVMGFQQLYSEIMTNAELSKNFREHKEAVVLQVAKDPSKYRPESLDYLVNSGRNEDGSMSYELDPSKIRQNINLDDDFRTNVRPMIEDMAKGKSYTYTDASGNSQSLDINNFDETHAKELLMDHLMDENVAEQAAYDFRKLSPEKQKQYGGDYHNYYVDKMLPKAIVNQNKTVTKLAEDKEGKASIELDSDEENPMTFKVEQVKTGQKLNPSQQSIVNLSEEEAAKLTPQQQTQRKEWMEGKTKVVSDIPMAAKATHTKPVKANTAITENMRTLAGGKIPSGVEIRDAEYGQTAVMPFVKSGKGKGDLINKEDLQNAEKDGNIEWKVGVTGTLKYGAGQKAKEVSIVRPADEIKSALDKHVDLGELQKIADQKNAAKKKAATGKTVSSSAIKAKVGTAGFEGYTEQELIDYYKSQGYNIN